MATLTFVDSPTSNVPAMDPVRDVPNIRAVHLSNGRTFKMKRTDPFGLIHIQWDMGVTPTELSGQYTSFAAAKHALDLYINNNIFATETPAPVEKAEPLKYKKQYRDSKTGENLPLEQIAV